MDNLPRQRWATQAEMAARLGTVPDVVNRALRDHEPMAWDFVMDFAKDNELQVIEACLLPDAPDAPAGSAPGQGAA